MRLGRTSFARAVCAAAFLLALTCVQAFAQAPTWGVVRSVEQPVSVRHNPDASSPLVRTLRPGDKVRVDFVQSTGWCAVFDPSEMERDPLRAIGYAEVRLLGPVAATAAPAKQPAAKPAPAEKPQPEKSAPAEPQPRPKSASKEGHSSAAPELKSEVEKRPATVPGQASAPQDPVRITSDKMVYSQTENAVIFLGNVHGTQKDMAIWANKVTAYFENKDKQKGDKAEKGAADKSPGEFGDKIERIVAEGSVRLASGKNEGACSTLIYYVADNIVRMEGNPILREGQNTVRGDIIKFYVKENRSEVLSGSKRRVEAVFFSPQGDKK